MSSIVTETSAVPTLEPEPRELQVLVRSIEGLNFSTELGNQQIAVSILFPGHMNDTLSPLFVPSPKINFEFSEKYDINFFPQTTMNALLSNPLEFYIYVCTPDFKKQTQVARFVFQFDLLLFNLSYSAVVEGSILPEGASVLSGEGLKATIECTWSKPLFTPSESEQSLIATFNISSVNALPQILLNCCAQPGNFSTHFFTYSLFAILPDGQVLSIEDGKFTSSAPDGSDASITFSTPQKFFIGKDAFEKWKHSSELDEMISVFLIPDLSPLIQPLGLLPNQYSALYGRADIPLSNFAKPGRSHFLSPIPLFRDPKWSESDRPMQILTPTGFPQEQPPDLATGKKKAPVRNKTLSSRNSAKSKPPSNAINNAQKKAKALSAKDKKLLQQIQAVLTFDPDTDFFKDSTSQLKVEVVLSKPLVPRSSTPMITKHPEEVIRPLPKLHENRLADATAEFCRQIELAIGEIKDNQGDIARLKKQIKEQLKPSIVGIVNHVYKKKPLPKADLTMTRPIVAANSEPTSISKAPSVSQSTEQNSSIVEADNSLSFIAELRTFLLTHLNKTLNAKFDLSYPRSSVKPIEMSVEHISNRINMQNYFHSDDLDYLHQKRCEVDQLNAQWPFEYALYLCDKKSPDSLNYFAQAIGINYTFGAAILGFCAQLTKLGNKSDALILLDMLYNMNTDDPVSTVCLSTVYTMMESSKSDEFLAKISIMSQTLPKSPYLLAASALIDVHDTYLTEIILSREQLQSGRTKDLLVLMARFNQLQGDYSRAQEYLKEALDIDREDHSIWKLLGDFQFSCGSKDKAKQSYQTLLSLADDPDPETCLKLALIQIQHFQYQRAFDLLMYSVQKTNSMLEWICLGICCLRLGDFSEANVAFEQANEMDRWLPITWGYCAILCIKTGRNNEAEQALCIACQLQLRDFRLITELITLFADQINSEEAAYSLSELRKVTEDQCHESIESKNFDSASIRNEEEDVQNSN